MFLIVLKVKYFQHQIQPALNVQECSLTPLKRSCVSGNINSQANASNISKPLPQVKADHRSKKLLNQIIQILCFFFASIKINY